MVISNPQPKKSNLIRCIKHETPNILVTMFNALCEFCHGFTGFYYFPLFGYEMVSYPSYYQHLRYLAHKHHHVAHTVTKTTSNMCTTTRYQANPFLWTLISLFNFHPFEKGGISSKCNTMYQNKCIYQSEYTYNVVD